MNLWFKFKEFFRLYCINCGGLCSRNKFFCPKCEKKELK